MFPLPISSIVLHVKRKKSFRRAGRLLRLPVYGRLSLVFKSAVVGYQGRSMHWIIGAIDVSWTYIGRNLSPMMRYASVLGSHFCQIVSAVVVCPSLDISTVPTPDRIITELSRPAFRAHLTTGNGGLDVQGNPGSEPWRPTCNLNLGLATAKRRAQDRSAWRKLVATATSSQTRSWRRRLHAFSTQPP